MNFTRCLLSALPGCVGGLIYFAGAWVVRHDSINYWLHDVGFQIVSATAETAYACGPLVLIQVGMLVGLPFVLALWFRARRRRGATMLTVISGLALIAVAGSFDWSQLVFLFASASSWLAALIVTVVDFVKAQPGNITNAA